MTNRKKPLFVTVVALSGLGLFGLAVACGGSGGAGGPEAKNPEQAANAGSSGGAQGGGSEANPASGGNTTGTQGAGGGTTTTALGDGGDLQGAKLSSSSHSEMETKGPSGPKAGPGHSQEPGRRVEDIQTIILARRDEARACYDKGLKTNPSMEGNIDIKWTIDPQGAVTDISVDQSKSQITEPSVGTCIIDIIKKVKFAPSSKGFETRAHYPFNFHPRNFPGKDAGK